MSATIIGITIILDKVSKLDKLNQWIKGKAEKITGEEADKAIKLRKKKYGISASLVGLLRKGKSIAYSIKLTN